MMEKMGISEDEMEQMSEQLMGLVEGDSFEPGGAETMPNFLQNLFGGDMPIPKEKEAKEASSPKTRQGRKEKPKHKFLDNYCVNICERARDCLLYTSSFRTRLSSQSQYLPNCGRQS